MESDSERKIVCNSCTCNEDKLTPVNSKWRCGKVDLLILDRYTHLGVEISQDYSEDILLENFFGIGKSQVGKVDVVLIDSHLDT